MRLRLTFQVGFPKVIFRVQPYEVSMKNIIKVAIALLCFFCYSDSGWAYDYEEKIYLAYDTVMQQEDGRVFAEIDNEVLSINELYLDEGGYYILAASYQHWVCSCCGYDLNMYRDYCFNCSKPRWWCE